MLAKIYDSYEFVAWFLGVPTSPLKVCVTGVVSGTVLGVNTIVLYLKSLEAVWIENTNRRTYADVCTLS